MLADKDEGGGVVTSAGVRMFLGGSSCGRVRSPAPAVRRRGGRTKRNEGGKARRCRGGGDDASSSPADAASGSGTARRVGGATGAEAPTGDVAGMMRRGGGGMHQWKNLWFRWYPNTRKCGTMRHKLNDKNGNRRKRIPFRNYRRTRGARLMGLSPFWEKVYLMYDEYFYFYFIPT
jgi:hypothetical protein